MLLEKVALLLIDIQNDFCQGGALPVPDGDAVVAVANQLMPHFKTVIATQDWHPHNHGSFASQHPGHQAGDVITLHGQPQTLWPDHCIQGSKGADFHPALRLTGKIPVFQKGTDREIDSYSAFYDNHHLRSTGLTAWLRTKGITDLVMMGLATDYCVKYSCLDAIADHFSVTLIGEGCRGINLSPCDVNNAWMEMQSQGAKIISIANLSMG